MARGLIGHNILQSEFLGTGPRDIVYNGSPLGSMSSRLAEPWLPRVIAHEPASVLLFSDSSPSTEAACPGAIISGGKAGITLGTLHGSLGSANISNPAVWSPRRGGGGGGRGRLGGS